MIAYLRYSEWQKWCWNGGYFDSDYFDRDEPVIVLDISHFQPYGGETLYKIHRLNMPLITAYIPLRFLSLEFIDNVIGNNASA